MTNAERQPDQSLDRQTQKRRSRHLSLGRGEERRLAFGRTAGSFSGAILNGLLGGDYHVYFVNSGSEANEAGFKFARQYMKHEHPGQYRFKTISRYFSYHGTTLATLDAGKERGTFFRPEIGDEVVVGFLNDDPRHPVILGMCHSSAKPAPEPANLFLSERLPIRYVAWKTIAVTAGFIP